MGWKSGPRSLVLVALLGSIPSAFSSAQPVPPVQDWIRELCEGRGLELPSLVAALEEDEAPGRAAEEALVALIRDDERGCQVKAAVVLGNIHPNRARPALQLVRQGLKAGDDGVRRMAARALGSMGAALRDPLPELAEVVRATDSPPLREMARWARAEIESRALSTFRFDELGLLAIAMRPQPVAYVITLDTDRPNVRGLKAGQTLLDGRVDRIDPHAIHFTGEAVSQDLRISPRETRSELFARHAPEGVTFGPSYTGEPISIDFEGDIAVFASVMAKVSGLGTILEAGTKGQVRAAAMDAPWDGVFEHGLKSGSFGYRLDHNIVRIARSEAADHMLMLGDREWSGKPVSFDLSDSQMDSLEAIFEKLSGLDIELPPGPHGPVTMFFQQTPWDELFDVLLASRNWTWRRDGSRGLVTARARE